MDIPVTYDQLGAWSSGTLIQQAMPDLTPEEREFLISGLMPGEFEAMWGEVTEFYKPSQVDS